MDYVGLEPADNVKIWKWTKTIFGKITQDIIFKILEINYYRNCESTLVVVIEIVTTVVKVEEVVMDGEAHITDAGSDSSSSCCSINISEGVSCRRKR